MRPTGRGTPPKRGRLSTSPDRPWTPTASGARCSGLYLFLAHLARCHTNEVLACQSLPDGKHVLRRWRFAGRPWFEVEGTPVCERAALIEPPIRVPDGTGAHGEVSDRL